MTDSVVVEGYARLKDGKKWKTRWIVFRKPSPVADCLLLLVFKDKADKSEERASVTLEEICGLESGGRRGEGEGEGAAPFTLAVVCLSQTTVLAFHSEETLAAWELRLRYSLGEVHRFSVAVMAGTKLESGPATLHLCNNLLALARDTPPVVVGHWNLPDLRRYGPVPDGFVFEGGTRCGYWAGVFLLASPEGEQISFLFDCIVRGVSPTRGPRGLLPVPPDAGIHRSSFQERLNQETRELEMRLSVLSNRNSAASPVYRAPPGDDDRSLSGSSENSDVGVSGRSAVWTPSDGGAPDARAAGAEKAAAERVAGDPSGVEDPGRLRESGRRSSLDSGIATGSHSSYSGSFSSCTESLDASGAQDFVPVFSLAQDLGPCRCPNLAGHEYKVPTQLRYLYDTPRTLVRDDATSAKDSDDPVTESLKGSSGGLLQTSARSQSGKSRATPSGDNPESGTTKSILTVCSVCGGVQGVPFHPASGATTPALPDKRPNGREERRQADPAYEVMEGRAPEPNSEGGDKSKYEPMLGCGARKSEMEGGGGAFPRERPAVTYVNIPVSPTSKKQLNYMEVELRDSAGRGAASAQNKGKESTKYAQIDIAATETAHKVGTQHALGREEGLRTLERRKKGTPH